MATHTKSPRHAQPLTIAIKRGLLRAPVLALILAGMPLTATGQAAAPDASSTIEQLRQELREILQQDLEQRQAPKSSPSPDRNVGAEEERPGTSLFGSRNERARRLAARLIERLFAEMNRRIEQDLGPRQAIAPETIPLEAVNKKGDTIEVPVDVLTRPLRRLTVPETASRTYHLVGTEDLGLALYDVLPQAVTPVEKEVFRRVYTGDDARAVAIEAKLVVALKGGEWAEPQAGQPAANAVAVRGLDLEKGLHPNANKTYDDTMYLVVDDGGPNPEVYEYRMTTESSSTNRGVGRLEDKQVVYVRGLHRGKDPAYRLKGNGAEGTRAGMEGTYTIVGANIHSAYSRRPIESDTPLKPNVSLGCQVIAASKTDFEKDLVELLDKKGIKEFPYTIVEGDELEVLDRSLTDRNRRSILVHGVPRKDAPPPSSTSPLPALR